MPLHVKLVATVKRGPEWPCEKCGTADVPVFSFVVFAMDGADTTERICVPCLYKNHEISAIIELPEQPSGRRPPSRQLVKRTRKEEFELAKNMGGKRQPGSGNTPYAKGDGVLKGIARWDSKMCFSKRASWDFDDLVKIRSEAAFGEVPAIITAYADRHTQQVTERWVTIPYEVWEEKIINGQKTRS